MTIDADFLRKLLNFQERVLAEADTFVHFALENEPENYINRDVDSMLAEFGDLLSDTYNTARWNLYANQMSEYQKC